MNCALTADEARRLLSYDPETGRLAWRVSYPTGHRCSGSEAGWVDSNYRRVKVNGRAYLVHRLAWLIFHGKWPSMAVDHINGDSLDNRIANLREATPALNAQNRRTPRRGSALGVQGVTARWGRYTAQITVRGKQHHLGLFATVDEARAAYVAAKRELHEGNTL